MAQLTHISDKAASMLGINAIEPTSKALQLLGETSVDCEQEIIIQQHQDHHHQQQEQQNGDVAIKEKDHLKTESSVSTLSNLTRSSFSHNRIGKMFGNNEDNKESTDNVPKSPPPIVYNSDGKKCKASSLLGEDVTAGNVVVNDRNNNN
eukprot:Pgem_evm1s14050